MKALAIALCVLAIGCSTLQTIADNLTSPTSQQAAGAALDAATAGTPLQPILGLVGGGSGLLGLATALLGGRRLKRKNAEQWKEQAAKDERIRALEREIAGMRGAAEAKGRTAR